MLNLYSGTANTGESYRRTANLLFYNYVTGLMNGDLNGLYSGIADESGFLGVTMRKNALPSFGAPVILSVIPRNIPEYLTLQSFDCLYRNRTCYSWLLCCSCSGDGTATEGMQTCDRRARDWDLTSYLWIWSPMFSWMWCLLVCWKFTSVSEWPIICNISGCCIY